MNNAQMLECLYKELNKIDTNCITLDKYESTLEEYHNRVKKAVLNTMSLCTLVDVVNIIEQRDAYNHKIDKDYD